MTPESGSEEGAEEAIEDLEAPAAAQDDVAGGAACGRPSVICQAPTCNETGVQCTQLSHKNVVYEQGPEALE
jgi:hypothetical protein